MDSRRWTVGQWTAGRRTADDGGRKPVDGGRSDDGCAKYQGPSIKYQDPDCRFRRLHPCPSEQSVINRSKYQVPSTKYQVSSIKYQGPGCGFRRLYLSPFVSFVCCLMSLRSVRGPINPVPGSAFRILGCRSRRSHLRSSAKSAVKNPFRAFPIRELSRPFAVKNFDPDFTGRRKGN